MKKSKILLSAAVILATSVTAMAQDNNSTCGDNLPEKGNWTVAATVGYNTFTTATAQPGNLYDYETSAPVINWTKDHVSLGIEGGYFFNDFWKLDFGGGINFTKNPGYYAVPGTVDPELSTELNMGNIPNYRAVSEAYTFTYYVQAGFDRYFHLKKVPNMALYCGLRAGFAYALNEQKPDEYDWMGKSSAESLNVKAAIAFGADYYFLPNMWVGISVEPFSYVYSFVTYKPQEGLSGLSANSHNFGLVTSPMLKIGFKF